MSCNDWKVVKLGDVLEFKRGYDLSKKEMKNGKYPVVGSNGIIGKHDKYTTESPCITIGRSGNVGTPYIYDQKCWAHNTTLYVANYKGNYPKFIYYLLKSINLAYYRGGSAVPTLNRNHIHPIEIIFPNILEEQKAIADTLSCLDDKIELNNRINKNLEEMAQAIFKSWFVDFEPFKNGEFENSELGTIPKGWKISFLGNLIKKNKEKINKYEKWKNELLIDLSNMPKFSISINNFDQGKKMKTNIFKLRKYDILFGSIRSYFGKAGFSPIDGVIAGTIHSYVPINKEFYSYILLLTSSKIFIDYTVAVSSGTKMPIVNWDIFCKFNCIYPKDTNIIKEFDKLVFPLIEKIANNILENQVLKSIRDALLPKLMSGEIRVPITRYIKVDK